jgi:hypothetical protein
VPVEHAQVIEVGAFADPDRLMQRIDRLPDRRPVVDAEAAVLPEEDHGLAVDLEIRGMIGVRGQQRSQGILHVTLALEKRPAGFKIDRHLETFFPRHVQQVRKLVSV